MQCLFSSQSQFLRESLFLFYVLVVVASALIHAPPRCVGVALRVTATTERVSSMVALDYFFCLLPPRLKLFINQRNA